jgi:putative methyltransferase (TIGR04325 family)
MDVLLLSSVLQYLPDPLEFIRSLLALGFSTIILDRVPFMNDGSTRLTVQQVPEWIGRASYPAWFFSESRLVAVFAAEYDIVASWPAIDDLHPDGGRATYKGFLYEAKAT